MSKGKYKRKKERTYQAGQKKQAHLSPGQEVINEKSKAENPANRTGDSNEENGPLMKKQFMVFWKWVKEKSSFTDWCLVVFTGVLAGAAIYQFIIMGRQLDEMQQVGRPYVFVEPSFTADSDNPARPVDALGKMHVNIHAQNSSQSPAIQVITTTPSILVGDKDTVMGIAKRCALHYPDPSEHPYATLAPVWDVGSSGAYAPTAISDPIEDKEWQRIKDGIDRIVVYGGVKYSGMKGGDFETPYCYVYIPKGMPFGGCGVCNRPK